MFHEIRRESCYTAFGMDAKSINTLELPTVLNRLAGHAAFSASKELAHALKPTDDVEDVRRRLAGTTEARTLLSMVPGLTIGGARDVRSAVTAATRGVILESDQLLDVKSTLIASRTLRRRFDKEGESYPVLSTLALGLERSSPLIEAITMTLDERGEVLDSASDKLATIRHDLRVSHDRLMGKLQRLLSDSKVAPMLQEPIITQRDGRFVIPLRAEFKGKVKSVIHDQSASGATLFVEPLTVVDLNNRLRELQLAERDEVRRILAELSGQVGGESENIIRSVEALAEIDLAFAKARYAEAMHANEPIMKPFKTRAEDGHPGSTLRLFNARHPLLDPETVVPIDLALDEDTFALVITGPNTGGKTVSLKTAGVLSLMAQCGLHIPALSGSELSTFDSVFADIGDEQSIEQSLSTFSSHISNIIDILKGVTSRSLVVLDELGAGTDPQEGAALARAILGFLLERRVTTLVATHYPELKVYAHGTPGVRNASVEFDLESLKPTYHLTIGLPGRSNALAIAGRLGLDEEVILRARKMVSPEDLRAESLLDEIHRQRDLIRADREEAEQARKEVQALEAKLAERLEAIDDERLELLEQARVDVEAEVDEVREHLRSLRRRLTQAGKPLEELKAIETEIEELEEQVVESVSSQITGLDLPGRAVDLIEEPLNVGDRVRLPTIDAEGVITGLDQEQAEVQVGRLRVRARLDELIPARDDLSIEHRPAEVRPQVVSRGVPQAPPLELNIRGRTVEDGLEELERRLDAAYLAGMPFVRVIHGKGTGRLREAIRQALKDNPYVSSFEPGQPGEGGDGVTVVRLAIS
ncbi:MAG: endonuclease MutS2 [Anaerolineaceae bacterium]|nr:MAG: endonuclease MutS2 [Anaerolineaceae bacterium]